MTQLDRLETLAEKRASGKGQGLSFEISNLLDALPDLIRVARTSTMAYLLWEDSGNGSKQFTDFTDAMEFLQKDLAPLYREVES